MPLVGYAKLLGPTEELQRVAVHIAVQTEETEREVTGRVLMGDFSAAVASETDEMSYLTNIPPR